MSQSLVIFLHGVGANRADLAPLGEQWRKALPQASFAGPDAPFPSGHGYGRQWFSLEGITPAIHGANAPAIPAAESAEAAAVLEKLAGSSPEHLRSKRGLEARIAIETTIFMQLGGRPTPRLIYIA